MKNQAKRIIALAICSVMLFGTLPLNGIVEIDFSKLNLFGRINLSEIELPGFSSFFSLKAKAAQIINSGTCGDNLTWTFDNEGTLTIDGQGNMFDYDTHFDGNIAPWYDYQPKKIIIETGVGSIGSGAFFDCTSLTNMTIPNSVTSIGNEAFINCTSLTSITIPNSVTSIGDLAFGDCTSLTDVTIPDSVISIGGLAFYDCTSLTNVTIPDSVTTIGDWAFGNCTSLTDVTIPNSVIDIGFRAFSDCTSLTDVTIPDSVTSIGAWAFCGCPSLTSIIIPDSVTTIGNSAFEFVPNISYYGTASGSPWGARCINGFIDGNLVYSDVSKSELIACCRAATGSIIIPDSVTSIRDYAFCECTSLTSITIPDSVTSIGNWAFYGCTSLTNVTIPNSVTSIGAWAFQGCTSLTSITIPNSVTSIGAWAFQGCASLTSITIPDSVTSIEDYTFHKCTSLTSITIPNSVVSIGYGAFIFCTSLASITIPNSVVSIGTAAFGGCTNLANVIIPDSVTDIGVEAFASCDSLTNVTISNSVTSIGEHAFELCPNLERITVNDGNPVYHIADNCLIETGSKKLVAGFKNCVIPGDGSVTSIGDYAFRYCISLTSITIPDSVTSIGDEAFRFCKNLTNITIPDSVTSIGYDAFGECSSLTNIAIPNSVTNIGDYAFSYCENLTSVNIPDSVTSISHGVFKCCSSLTDITIPDSVKNIRDWAFASCTSLTSITVPDSVTSIGDYAFSNCFSLKTIDLPASVTTIGGGYAFSGVVNVDITKTILNDSSDYYPWGANNINGEKDGCLIFRSGSDRHVLIACLTEATGEITIPEGVTVIYNYAFAYCTGISAVNIPDSVTYIGENAFYAVLNLKYSENMNATGSPWGAKGVNAYMDGIFAYYDEGTKRVLVGCDASASGSVIVPDTVREVGDLAFAECKELTSVAFTTDGVIDFGRDVFAGCSKLDSVSTGNNTVDDITYTTVSVANVNANGPNILGAGPEDNGVKYTEEKGILFCNRNKKGTFDVSDAKEVTFICENAFANCTGLTVSISSDNITSIGKDAFFNSGSYVKWNKEGVFAIDNYVIDANKEITSYEVPGSAVCIADEAFADCKNLSSLTFEDNDGISIGKRAFEGCSLLSALGNITGVRILRMGAYALKNAECYSAYKQDDGLVYLGSCVADADEGITQANIKAGTTCIAEGAFSDCVNLTSVTIPDSVSRIDENAFLACVSLTNISLPSSLRYLGRYAFKDCINLSEITIPAKVSKLGDYAFYGCLSLKSFDVENGNSNYSAKDGVLFDKSGSTLIQYPAGRKDTGYNVAEEVTKLSSLSFRKCTNLQNVIVSEGIKYGYRNPFEGCEATINGEDIIYSESGDIKTLVYVSKSEISELGGKFTVPADVTHIGANAFAGCKELTEIVFAENSNLIAISEEAFKDCTGLTDIKLPANLKTIGEQAFLNCANLENIEFENPENIEAIYDYAFAGCNMDCDSSTNEGREAIRDKFGFTDGMQMQEYSFHRHKTPEGSAEPVTVKAATCTEPGLEKMSCTECGKDYYNDIPPLGHNFTDYIYNNDATAEKDGTKTAKCSRCDATDTITAEGTKELSNYTIGYTYSDDYSECTLTAVSKTDESIIEKQTVPASIKETKPTCTEDGLITYTYTFDGMFAALSHSKTVAVPSPGHSFTDYKYNNDATTEKDGTETARCDRCAATDTRTKAGTKLNATEEPAATTIEISNYTATKKVDYKTTITFKAEVENSSGSETVWYVNGQKAGTGETFTVNKATESFTIYCATKDANGNEVKSQIETVNVDSGFFARIVAFFKGIFGLLPNITQ